MFIYRLRVPVSPARVSTAEFIIPACERAFKRDGRQQRQYVCAGKKEVQRILCEDYLARDKVTEQSFIAAIFFLITLMNNFVNYTV